MVKKKREYFPDDRFPKIQFESGEIAWLRHDDGETLLLIFEDGTSCERMKDRMPGYKIIQRPAKKH
jgi:hypothetical protein